jgi:hypothetical protein
VTPARTLLRALAEHLRRDVQPALSGFVAYQNRVAANLVELLARDAALAPARRRLDRDLAHSQGLDSEAVGRDLAQRLRDGRVAVTPELLDSLRERSLLALAVDNPRYSAYGAGRRRWPGAAARIDAALAADDDPARKRDPRGDAS